MLEWFWRALGPGREKRARSWGASGRLLGDLRRVFCRLAVSCAPFCGVPGPTSNNLVCPTPLASNFSRFCYDLSRFLQVLGPSEPLKSCFREEGIAIQRKSRFSLPEALRTRFFFEFWRLFGSNSELLGRLGASLGRFWAALGHLGAVLGGLGVVLGSFGWCWGGEGGAECFLGAGPRSRVLPLRLGPWKIRKGSWGRFWSLRSRF